MPSLNDVVSGASALASDVQQLIDAWKGTVGKGIPASLTAVNDAINYALSVRNNESGASKALIVYKADATVLFQVDKNGVIASPDGTTGASQISTLTGTQTFTNKTLTAPHMTTPVVDSGGLQVTAGNVGIGTAPISNTGLQVGGTITPSGGVGIGVLSAPTLPAQANLDSLYGTQIAPTFTDASFTGVAQTGLAITPTWFSNQPSNANWISVGGAGPGNTSDTVCGLHVYSITGTDANHYGVKIDPPSGATVANFGLSNDGAAQVNGSGTALSFFGHAANAIGTVSGSRGGNAALGALITVLASYGLLVDSSTA